MTLPADALSPPLPWLAMLAALAIVFGAGIVRGFAGFGFSALSVGGLALLVSPARVVPAIFVLEVLASAGLLKGARRDIDWPWLSWLVAGNALFIPLGIVLLAWLPETQLRLLIGALLVLAAAALRSGFRFALAPTPRTRLAVGLVSGLVNGVAAIGGIAVAVLLSTSTLAPAALRATLIALFLFTDLWALGWAALLPHAGGDAASLVGVETLRWALWLIPPMLIGIRVGQRSFAGVSAQAFRRQVLNLLIVVAAISLARSAIELAR